MISQWITEENFEKDGIELFSTQALHEVAEDIYNDLLMEMVRDG